MDKTCGNCLYREKVIGRDNWFVCIIDGEMVAKDTQGCYRWELDEGRDK